MQHESSVIRIKRSKFMILRFFPVLYYEIIFRVIISSTLLVLMCEFQQQKYMIFDNIL